MLAFPTPTTEVVLRGPSRIVQLPDASRYKTNGETLATAHPSVPIENTTQRLTPDWVIPADREHPSRLIPTGAPIAYLDKNEVEFSWTPRPTSDARTTKRLEADRDGESRDATEPYPLWLLEQLAHGAKRIVCVETMVMRYPLLFDGQLFRGDVSMALGSAGPESKEDPLHTKFGDVCPLAPSFVHFC
ncbi:hypothetical protein IAR50_004285 [Cryptococcus sp. DSM 104548]